MYGGAGAGIVARAAAELDAVPVRGDLALRALPPLRTPPSSLQQDQG